MSYRLQMSAEIYDWLTELRDSDPPSAALAAQALAALAAEGDRLGSPLVTAVTPRLSPDDLESALNQHYQARLESMNAIRREVAGAATLRKRIELQLTELEPPPDPAGLRERLAAAREAEEQLTAASQREQMQVDAFRTRKEVLKAAYTAAQAEELIEQAQNVGDDDFRPADSAGAAARLDEIIGQIEQELGLQELGPEAPAGDLLELRPGAPADSGIRILFAVEPPGTALLIAVLEGEGAVRDHYHDAVLLASEVLQETRAYRAREASAHTFGDAQSFLEEFFPGRTDELRTGSASAHEVITAYWAAAEARNWEAFGALLADDVIYRGPQTREQVRGRDPYVRFNAEGFTYDWHLTVQRIVGEGQHAASWIEFTGPEGTQSGLCFFDLADDGKIAAITDFWPDPYDLPATRAHLVERY